jgi:hypothetical protein
MSSGYCSFIALAVGWECYPDLVPDMIISGNALCIEIQL